MSTSCLTCQDSFGNKPIVSCGHCTNIFHVSCTKLTPTEVRALETKKAVSLVYLCTDCKTFGGNSNLQSLLSSLNNQVATLQNQVTELTNLSKDIDSLKSQVVDQGLSISNLNSDLDCVKSQVHSISDELKILKSTNPSIGNSAAVNDDCIEHVINEAQERNSRACNVIFYGLPTPNSNSNDKKEIKDLLKNLGVTSPVVQCFRFGQTKPKEPRPLKCILSSRSDVFLVLKNKNRLPKTVSVSSDKTKQQRLYLEKLSEARKSHNNEFPNDLKTIKYVNGVPHLVSAAHTSTSTHKNTPQSNASSGPASTGVSHPNVSSVPASAQNCE